MKNYVLLIALVSSVASITRAADRHEVAARIAAAHARTAARQAAEAATYQPARTSRQTPFIRMRPAPQPPKSRAHELSSTQHALHTLVVDPTFNQFREEDAVRAQENKTPKTAMQAILSGDEQQAQDVIEKLKKKALSDNGQSKDAHKALRILRKTARPSLPILPSRKKAAQQALYNIELEWKQSSEYPQHCYAVYKYTVQPLLNNLQAIATPRNTQQERCTLVDTLFSLYEQGSEKAELTLHYLAETPYTRLKNRVKKAAKKIQDPAKKEAFLEKAEARRAQHVAEKKYYARQAKEVAWAREHVKKKTQAIRAAKENKTCMR